MKIAILLLCCVSLDDVKSFESLLPPLPDFRNHVDYAEWIGRANEVNRVHIVDDWKTRRHHLPILSKSDSQFIEEHLKEPKAWDASEKSEVAKWVHEVRANSSKYLHKLPWTIFYVYPSLEHYFFSVEHPSILLNCNTAFSPNARYVEDIVHANIMAALEKKEKQPLQCLEGATLSMEDLLIDLNYETVRLAHDAHHDLCIVTMWVIQNRDCSQNQVEGWVKKLTGMHAGGLQERFVQSMRLQCAEVLSLIQWMASYDADDVLRYDSVKLEKFYSVSVNYQGDCPGLMRNEADPAKDAQRCRQYYESLCEGMNKTIKEPGSVDFLELESRVWEQPYGACASILFRENFHWVSYTFDMERERRLDCLRLDLLVYHKEHAKWPKSLKDLPDVNPNWLKDPKNGKPFQYCVDKKNQPYLDNEAFPGKKTKRGVGTSRY